MVTGCRQWYKYFLFSIMCHAMLLIFFCKISFPQPVGRPLAVMEQVYLFHPKNNHSEKLSQKSSQPQSHIGHLTQRLKKQSTQLQALLTPGKRSRLLEQLHDDIARHLMYPAAAVSLDLTGTVTLKFLMLPSGAINSISVMISSGSPILDNAASNTLQAISPFIPAAHYLQQPDYFTIPITFEMQ